MSMGIFGSGVPDPLVLTDGTFTDLTATGSFTSPGIDDNANATAITIDSSEYVLIGTTSFSFGGNHELRATATADSGDSVWAVGRAGGTASYIAYAISATGENAANAALKVRQDGVTSRSINTAGTVNAGGTDYAEYEFKADGCGEFAKGDLVGFNADGKLTDVFADAVSFGIKSTNPSYVGGDTWHDGLERPEEPAKPDVKKFVTAEAYNEALAEYQAAYDKWQSDFAVFEAALEEKRQKVDRIAYAGKVPVNGIDGATPGNFVLAADDNGGIKAITKASPTMAEYTKLCVGKVRCNGPDGRAIVEVKMG